MNHEIYADVISAIHVTGNIVRVDLMTQQPHLKSDDGQPVFESSKRIIMPLEGFIQSFPILEDIIKQLIGAGIVDKDSKPDNEIVNSDNDRKEKRKKVNNNA